jgi:hypothetical protein
MQILNKLFLKNLKSILKMKPILFKTIAIQQILILTINNINIMKTVLYILKIKIWKCQNKIKRNFSYMNNLLIKYMKISILKNQK